MREIRGSWWVKHGRQGSGCCGSAARCLVVAATGARAGGAGPGLCVSVSRKARLPPRLIPGGPSLRTDLLRRRLEGHLFHHRGCQTSPSGPRAPVPGPALTLRLSHFPSPSLSFPVGYDGSPGGGFGGNSRRRRPMSANGTRIRSSSIRWAQSGEQGSLASRGDPLACCGRGPGVPGEQCLPQVGRCLGSCSDRYWPGSCWAALTP